MSRYMAVFGQLYYPAPKCPLEIMWQCETILQWLCISRYKTLKKYVTENNIVDLDKVSGNEFVDGDDDDEDVIDEHKYPFEMDFNAVDTTESYDMGVIEDSIFAEMDQIDIPEQHKQPLPSEGYAMLMVLFPCFQQRW